ncbi:MAG: glycosyltransferase family 9 protein [Bacteroidales bacterium]|nr:glycosyltransferase family 9 protein [Bacteroidales bacterium]
MQIKTDCKYYLAYKPCVFHKIDGRLCENCNDYSKIAERILIIKLDALGDVLRTTSILPALKNKYPNSEITWITKKNAFTLLNGNQYIDRVLAIEENYLQVLLSEEFDIGICLDADPQSASILSITKAKEKFGFVSGLNGKVVIVNNKAETWWKMGVNDELKMQNRTTYQKHIYDICELNQEIEKPQIKLDEKSVDFADKFKIENQLNKYSKIIGINTGGGTRWQFKKWILEYYIELIKIIKKENPDFGILLFGGPEEIEMNEKIKMEIPDLLIDAGCKNSITEFSALINLTELFFTSDSLGMHISVALEKNTIVLVGPTSPWELDVFGKGEIVYNQQLKCIACYKSTCDFKENCMNTLKPEFVYSKMKKYLV